VSEAVVVTDGGNGLPTLTLNDSEVATYAGPVGSSTTALSFSYMVQPGDFVPDLEAIGINLPAGTTIKDLANNNTDFTGFAPINAAVQVVEPTLPAGDLTSFISDIAAINAGGADAAPDIAYTIALTGGIGLTSGATVVSVEGIRLAGGSTLTIAAGGHRLDGGAGTNGLFVDSAGLAVDDLVLQNALLAVASGGVASGTTVSSGGADYVESGGIASGTTVDGGTEFVEVGGTANGTPVSAGAQVVYGLANGTELEGGSYQYVEAGGTAFATNVTSGVEVIAGLASGTMLSPGGQDYVESGGIASATNVGTGVEFVEIDGTAINTTASGGAQVVYGVASGTVLDGGAFQYVEAGGTASTVPLAMPPEPT
jgi:autotransporter passenger strand-loop-strand repeat protein